MSDLIRVLVADDHTVVRQGLCSVITPRNGMEVVGEAANGAEAVDMVRSLLPDVILMDLLMPEKSGLEAIVEIRQENPHARIIVLTSFGEEDRISAAITAGALGYLLKDASTDELFHAIHEVYSENLSLQPAIANKLMQNLRQPKQGPSSGAHLTSREIDVLRELALGLSNQEIAARLVIGETTVRTHVSKLLEKLGLSNRTQMALYAIDAGIAEHNPPH